VKSILPFVILFFVGLLILVGARLLIVRVIENPKKKKEQEPKEK